MDYAAKFHAMQIRSERLEDAKLIAASVLSHREKYDAVEAQTGVPWWWIGIVHGLEGGMDFRTHLHNGDPLTRRTVHKPVGRPVVGEPPFTWEESAIDALTMKGYHRERDWSLAKALTRFERYNGTGYILRGVPSPYLWSFSTEYVRGKYVKDGVFDASAVSKQCGAAVVLKILLDQGAVTLMEPLEDDGEHIVYDTNSPVSEAVRAIQRRLNALGYADRQIVVDGLYGPRTRSAVLDFQAENDLVTDGKCGPVTWRALMADTAKPWPVSTAAEGGIDGMRAAKHPEVVAADREKAIGLTLGAAGAAKAAEQTGVLDAVQSVSSQMDAWKQVIVTILAMLKFFAANVLPVLLIGASAWFLWRHRQQISAIKDKLLRFV